MEISNTFKFIALCILFLIHLQKCIIKINIYWNTNLSLFEKYSNIHDLISICTDTKKRKWNDK